MVRCLLYVMGVILLLGIQNSSVQAQIQNTTHNHAQCGVDLAEGQAIKNRMLDNRRNRVELLEKFERGRGNDSTTYVPIQFHIVNRSDGTGGEKNQDILDNLCRLNADYLAINVEFYLAGPTRVINQDLLYTNSFDNGMANYFMGLYRVPGVVNIFVGNQISNSQSGGTTLGYYTSGLDIIYAIQSSVRGTGTTLTHELGHFFGLPHTFFGWEGTQYSNPAQVAGLPNVMSNTTGRTPSITTSGITVENIARSGGLENCQIAGDAFCDTDANYLFGFFGSLYNDGCTYAATAMDPRGWLFRPDAIAPTPTRFKILEDETDLDEMWLKNNSTKDYLYPKTLVVTETEYTLGGNTTLLMRDTLGHNDTLYGRTETNVFVPANSDYNLIYAIFSPFVRKGYINLNGHYLDVSVSAPTAPSLAFVAAPAEYTITSATGIHRTDMDSLRVTNTSATVTVAMGTDIVATDIFYNGSTQVSSGDRIYTLPNALAPGESYTFSAVDLRVDATLLAGVTFGVNTYAPYRDTTGTTSENVMSYYDDVCATQFSNEQGDAMKMDIASRGFSTLYSTPSDITIIDTAVVIHPVDNSIAPQPLVHFAWNPVNGATMYHLRVYEINAIGAMLLGGQQFDVMVTGTDYWQTLNDGSRYEWVVTPLNATTFCDRGIASEKAKFRVYNWNVGVENVEAEIQSSKIYPNPSDTRQDVILEVESTIVGAAQITIFNGIGQEVMPTQAISLVPGNNVQKLSTSTLAAGLYVVNVKTANGTTSHKLLIKE
ncbi:MAG: Unknown protein [uncultured Aureispira sp.]|uniref:Secretion system C-terminal sorting domain-containing protein n=1 Tax=uncultured Aureispira sp. TaxID=1331704 RepID=A0A6S6U4F5_9BACT|nr:MAG: Unknown protein [uncultured Aureispira sp.]